MLPVWVYAIVHVVVIIFSMIALMVNDEKVSKTFLYWALGLLSTFSMLFR